MIVQEKTGGIYQQIAEYGIEQVLSGDWSAGDRIPSVRQLAAEVGVNPNTVMSAYEQLKHLEVIETRRGLGFFVADEGRSAALSLRRRRFIDEELPRLRRALDLLSISPTELQTLLFPEEQSEN